MKIRRLDGTNPVIPRLECRTWPWTGTSTSSNCRGCAPFAGSCRGGCATFGCGDYDWSGHASTSIGRGGLGCRYSSGGSCAWETLWIPCWLLVRFDIVWTEESHMGYGNIRSGLYKYNLMAGHSLGVCANITRNTVCRSIPSNATTCSKSVQDWYNVFFRRLALVPNSLVARN